MERAHQENDAMKLEVLVHKHAAKQMETVAPLYIHQQPLISDDLDRE